MQMPEGKIVVDMAAEVLPVVKQTAARVPRREARHRWANILWK
jgi:hypothetical protein